MIEQEEFMFGSPSKAKQELIWHSAMPLIVGVLTYVIMTLFTRGLFPLFEFGIAIAVGILVWRLSRRKSL